MLKVENLEFGFRHRRLFTGLTLTVAPGELVHLAGHNGAGKSTLMAIVAGLIAAERGTIDYLATADSQPNATAVDDRRLYLEYLPAEANGLYLKISAVQNLKFWGALRGLQFDDAAIHAALDIWGLNKPMLRDNFPVEKFSTGMKRRLALARLMLSPAPCWLLDEPFYGLDQEATQIFRQQLANHLTQKGGLALVVSHELTAMSGLVTRTVTLNQKSHVPEAKPAVLTHVKRPFT